MNENQEVARSKVNFILQIPLTLAEHLDRRFWKVLIMQILEFGDKEFT